MTPPPSPIAPLRSAYVRLALATNFRDYDATAGLPSLAYGVSVELYDAKLLKAVNKLLSSHGWLRSLCQTPMVERYCAGFADSIGVRLLAALPLVARLEIAAPFAIGRPPVRRPTTALLRHASSAAAVPQDITGVVLGVIDSGIPFLHAAICRDVIGKRSTRMLSMWDQDTQPDFVGLGQTPSGFGYGAELSRAAINRAIQLAHSGSFVDEDRCYALVGYGAVSRSKTHGSHVLGLLAGDRIDEELGLSDENCIEARDADVIAVQLPRAVLNSPSRAAMCRAVLDGIAWMLSKVPKTSRLVVAIPYGSTLGPHDGSSFFERALDDMVAAFGPQRLTVVLPTGNSYLWNVHAELNKLMPKSVERLVWRAPPESEAATRIEIWVPQKTSLAIRVRPPGQALFDKWIQPSETTLIEANGERTYAIANATNNAATERMALVRLEPTKSSSGGGLAPSGRWDIEIKSTKQIEHSIHAYGSRARGSFGASLRGRQGRFVKLSDPSSGWYLNKLGTISGMATGSAVAVVGGYINWKAPYVDAAKYTGAGPTRDGRYRVNYSRPSDHSAALGGMRSSGTRSAVTFRMDGSSIAVPQVARILAHGIAVILPPDPAKYPFAPIGPPLDRLGTPVTTVPV